MNKNEFTAKLKKLTPKPRNVLELMLLGKTDDEIAAELKTSSATVRKHVQNLCDHFGLKREESGLKRNRREDLLALLKRYQPWFANEPGSVLHKVALTPKAVRRSPQKAPGQRTARSRKTRQPDWGEAVDVSMFYGRTEELSKLKDWIVSDRCRLLALLGMAGIGKTTLSVKLAEELQGQFEFIVWRSLRNAPSIESLLADLIQVLANKIELPETTESKISLLINFLRRSRCLIVLDNVEAILCENPVGSYPDKHKGYGRLLRRIGEEHHESCLVITSREKPKEFTSREGASLQVRSLVLPGLKEIDAQAILEAKGVSGSTEEYKNLNEWYGGNPLYLKLVATTIQNLFGKNISQFLEQKTSVFDGIRSLIEKQFDRLSTSEKKVIYWLAINRQPVSLSELQEDILSPTPKRKLLEPLQALERRSLIETAPEKDTSLFTLQPVVLEYVTLRFIEEICDEVESKNTQSIQLLNSHALIKAQANDYIRESQTYHILESVSDCLITILTSPKKVEERLEKILFKLQSQFPLEPGYAGGNVLNLLCHALKVDLSDRDFSNLFIWQAYLQNVNLHRVKFNNCNLKTSVFTEVLGDVLSVAFSPSSNLLAAGDAEGKVHLWEVDNGTKLSICVGHTGWVRSVAFSPDGKLLVSGSDDRTVKLWDVATGRVLNTLEEHKDWVRSVAFSPAAPLLVSCGDDHLLKLWNVETGTFLNSLEGHTDRVRSVAFSPDGRTIVSGGDDQTLRLWNVSTGECIGTLERHTDKVRSVAFSRDGKTIASGGNDRILRLWNIETGECLESSEKHNERIRSIALSPNGQTLVTGGDDRLLKLWDVQGNCLETLKGHTNHVWSVAFSPQGNRFASGGDDQQVKLWDIEAEKCLRTFQGYTNGVRSVAFAPQRDPSTVQSDEDRLGGYTLISGGDDHVVRIWHVGTDERPEILKGHKGRVHSVAFSPDGSLIASGGSDQTLRLWDAQTGEELKTLLEHTYWVGAVAFSPDSQTLASGGGERLLLWNLRGSDRPTEIPGHEGWVRAIAFSPDGERLATGGDDQTVRLWDAKTRKCLRLVGRHAHRVESVAFSPFEGRFLASGSDDNTVKLWDLTTGQCRSLEEHSRGVQSVTFSPDGQLLASGSDDQTVKLWDVKTERCLQTFSKHQGWVRSVAFSPDGLLLASASQDTTILIWNVQTGDLLKRLSSEKPYEGMEINKVTDLSKAQREALIALGAVDHLQHNF